MNNIKSIWYKDAGLPRFSELDGDKKTDVLIVGGGIVGILCAHLLEQHGVPCILVEKNRICSGTTGNTTAKLTYQHGFVYHKLIKDGGVELARAYLEANRSAFDAYTALFEDIDCDCEEKDNYVYTVSDRRGLEDEAEALVKIGYDFKLVDSLPIPVKCVGAICFKDQAQFHPLKLLSGIVKKLTIFENTFVREIRGDIAITDRGNIRFKRAIIATHFPFINRHGAYFLKLYQHRSYVCALKNADDVGGMYVDESGTGLSFRNHGELLLLGGGAHRTGKAGGNYTELRRFAEKHYPNASEVCHWAAQDCMSLDSRPYIGPYSKATPHLYVASGFNKWGMTGSMLAAMLLCEAVRGVPSAYAETFSPSRSILKPQLFINIAETATNMLTPTTKRCPHLGCALKWNPTEHTWDCPCHGSRFSRSGEILNNPANKSNRA